MNNIKRRFTKVADAENRANLHYQIKSLKQEGWEIVPCKYCGKDEQLNPKMEVFENYCEKNNEDLEDKLREYYLCSDCQDTRLNFIEPEIEI